MQRRKKSRKLKQNIKKKINVYTLTNAGSDDIFLVKLDNTNSINEGLLLSGNIVIYPPGYSHLLLQPCKVMKQK